MTPTLLGRWQTRILLLVLVWLPVSFVFAKSLVGWSNPAPALPFVFLEVMFAVGLLLDPVYIALQRLRWDQDWPFAFQLGSMITEVVLTYVLLDGGWLVAIYGPLLLNVTIVAWHFLWLVLATFIALLGGLQVLFIRWRFKGGELGRFPKQKDR